MTVILTCPHCGQNTTVADPMRPGRCKCGLSLGGAHAAHSAPQSATIDPGPIPDPGDQTGEAPPFTMPPPLNAPYIKPTPSGVKAPQAPMTDKAPDQPDKRTPAESAKTFLPSPTEKMPLESPPQAQSQFITQPDAEPIESEVEPIEPIEPQAAPVIPQLVIPEPDTPEPEPDTSIPEPDTPEPEPDTSIPEPDTPEPEPAPKKPKLRVAKPQPEREAPLPILDPAEPQPQEEPEGQNCPSCQTSVPPDSVICVNCGYNFKTGKAVEATAPPKEESPEEYGFESPEDDEDDGPSLFQQIKPLLKLAVFGVIAAGVGWIVFYSLQSRYGVSADTPLGTSAKIQAYFKSIGLKNEGERASPFTDCRRLVYSNPVLVKQSHGRFSESVYLVFDKGGKFIGIGADFWSTDMPGGTAVQGFMYSYWKEIGGKPTGAEFETAAINAKWDKGNDMMPVHEECVEVALKGSSFEKEHAIRIERLNNPLLPISIP